MENIFLKSISILLSGNSEVTDIVFLSFSVTILAVILSSLLSLPFAAYLSISKFRGKRFIVIFVNSLMALPPVVVGLILYLLVSASGPLAAYQLLYTAEAMIIAQIIILTPIIISLSKQSIDSCYMNFRDFFIIVGVRKYQQILTMLWETRISLTTNLLAAIGRGLSEVGAVIIVGGNIAHQTRVMTTTIAMETSRGNLELALSIGILLIIISLFINILLTYIKEKILVNRHEM